MPPKQTSPKPPVLPTGFEVLRRILPTNRAGVRGVRAFKAGANQARVRFSPGALLTGKLSEYSRLAVAELANGMWAVVPDPDGYVVGTDSNNKEIHSIRVGLVCRFSEPAELLHGLWVFPPHTFALPSAKPQTEPSASPTPTE